MDAKQCGKEFWRGLSCPSWGGLIGTLCVAAAWFSLCLWGITPSLLRNPKYTDYFEGERDGYARLSAHVLRITQQEPQELSVVILSDSSGREAIEVADLQNFLTQDLGCPVHVEMLAGNRLSQWGQVAITDAIRDHIKGVVLLEISPDALASELDIAGEYQRWVAVGSDAFRDELRQAGADPPPHWGNYFLDNYRFFVARTDCVHYLLPWSNLPPLWVHPTDFDHARPWPSWRYLKARKAGLSWMDTYDANHLANLGIYQRMIQRLRANSQIKVGLYQGIENPLMGGLARMPNVKHFRSQYAADMHDFERANCVPYFSCIAEAGVNPDDFWDPYHVRTSSARLCYSDVLAQHVEALLKPQSTEEDWPTVEAAMAPRTPRASTTQACLAEQNASPATNPARKKKHP